jgi:hypothetical protein
MPVTNYIPLFPNLQPTITCKRPHRLVSPLPSSVAPSTLTNDNFLPTPDAEAQSPSLSSANNNIPPSPEHLQIEISLLRQQNAHLLARQARYEATLHNHRAYYRLLEARLDKKASGVLLWKNAGLKAYGLVEARDERIEELEKRTAELERAELQR